MILRVEGDEEDLERIPKKGKEYVEFIGTALKEEKS